MASLVSKKLNLSMAKRPKRQSPRVIYLACEGTETEYWYFKSLDEALDEDANVQLRIYPDQDDQEEIKQAKQKGVKTDHKSLCAKAAEKLQMEEGVDEAWIIIDKDRHLGLEETFEEAGKKGVKIGFSSISFEHWLLLHFEKNDTTFDKSDCKNETGKYVKCGSNQPKYPVLDCKGKWCVAGFLRLRNYIPDYDKSNRTIFKLTQPNHARAYENAAWLRCKIKEKLDLTGGKVFKINPYTNIDQLLKSIYGLSEVINWIDWEQAILVEGFEITFTKKNNTCLLQICNISDRSQIVLPSMFYLTDSKGEIVRILHEFGDRLPNLCVHPRDSTFIAFPPYMIPKKGIHLNARIGEYRLIIEDK